MQLLQREGWNDNPCTFSEGFVCEHNKESLPGVTDPPPQDGCPEVRSDGSYTLTYNILPSNSTLTLL